MSSRIRSVTNKPKPIAKRSTTQKIPLKKGRTSATKEPLKNEKKKREPKIRGIRATKNRFLVSAFGTFEPRKRKIRNLSELCSLKAGELFSHVFKLSTQARFTYNDDSVDTYSAARDWFERADATQQCENTAPGKKDLLKTSDLCYICGLPLIINGKQNGPLECEHILPVAQACLFLDLYRSEYKEIMKSGNANLTSLQQQIKQNLAVEYNWAHQCCNQIKSSISFVKFDDTLNEFVLDEDSSTRILKGIFYGKMKNKQGIEENRKYCDGIKAQLLKKHKSFNAFRNERLELQQKEAAQSLNQTIKPILSILNQNYNKGKNKGFYFLSILSNLILAADATLVDAATRSSTGNGIIIPPPNESDEKMKVYTKLSLLFAQFLDSKTNGLDIGRDREKRLHLDDDLLKLFLFRDDLLQQFNPILRNGSFDSDNFNKFIMKLFLSNKFLHEEQLRITYSTLYRNLFSMLFFMKEPNDQISATKEAGLCLQVILICLFIKNIRHAKEHAISFQLNPDGKSTKARETLIKLERVLVDVIVTIIKKMKDEHDNSTEIFNILLSVYGYINSNSTAELEPFFTGLDVKKYDDMDAKLLTSTTEYYEQFSDEFEIKALDEHEISKLEVGAARAFSNIHLDKEIQYDDVASMFEKPSLPDEMEIPPTQSNPLDLLSSAAEIQSASNILSTPATTKRERSASKSPITDTESDAMSPPATTKRERLASKSPTTDKESDSISPSAKTKRERSENASPITDRESDVENVKKRVRISTRKLKSESSTKRPNSRRSQKRSRSGSTSGESDIDSPPRQLARITRSGTRITRSGVQ